jgi:hypothetical protein
VCKGQMLDVTRILTAACVPDFEFTTCNMTCIGKRHSMIKRSGSGSIP